MVVMSSGIENVVNPCALGFQRRVLYEIAKILTIYPEITKSDLHLRANFIHGNPGRPVALCFFNFQLAVSHYLSHLFDTYIVQFVVFFNIHLFRILCKSWFSGHPQTQDYL